MAIRDYYAVLGVPRDASLEQVEQTYAALQRKMPADSPEHEGRARTISEAYTILSDPHRRAKYDRLLEQESQSDSASHTARIAFGEFFKTVFGREPSRMTDRPRTAGASPRGQDIETDITVTLEEVYYGATRMISKGDRRLQVKFPRGVRNGSRVRLEGEGLPGTDGGPQGDLYLNVRVEEDDIFTREDDDLHETISVDLFTALLGGQVGIRTMQGKALLKIEPGTQPGQLIRLRGKGMPRLDGLDEFGDLYVRVQVDLPTELTAKERALWKELASMRGHRYD
jgi:DnaJ-class molecular chaperone